MQTNLTILARFPDTLIKRIDGFETRIDGFENIVQDAVGTAVSTTVAEALVVQPLVPQAEVEHGKGGVAGDLLVHGQELWQPGYNIGAET